MAKKRFIATSIILTTLLAGGGAAALYFTSSGGAWWNLLAREGSKSVPTSHRTGADDASRSKSASDLDAVASAWAQRTTAPDSTEASPRARSAGVTLARADSPSTSTAGDRYRDYEKAVFTPVERELSTVDSNSEASPSAPAPSAEAEPTKVAPPVAPAADRYRLSADQSATESVTIARGQDSPATADRGGESLVIAPLGDAESSDMKSKFEASDVRQPDSDQARAGAADRAAADRARQAFSEQPASAAPDRYAPAAAQQGETTASRDTAPSYPFATQASRTNPIAGQAPDATSSGSQLPPPSNNPFAAAAAGANSNYPMPPDNARTASNALSGFSGYGNQVGARPDSGSVTTGANTTGIEGSGRPGERALEGAQNPALVIQKLAPAEIQVNKPAKFVIQVRNVGGQAAADVAIRDQVPKGTQLLSTTPAAETSGGQLLWRIGNLSIGEERSIEMQLMPITEGEVGSVATVTCSAQASVKTRSTMPQLAIRMTTPKQVMVGQEHRVKIFLHNPGSGDATGVMLFENVPENVRHEAGSALEFEIGTLRAGETRELELILLAEKPGKVTNVLTARAEGNLQVQQQVDFEVIAPALTVAVVGPERRYLERPATYEVRVENPGTAPARDIQLVTKLPKGMKFIRANNMGEYDAGTHAVYWSLAELPEGEHGSVELVAMPIEPGPQTLEVEGHAQQGLSDQAKHPVLVEGLAAIMFELRDLMDPIEVGRETGYEIRVVNQGTKAATNVQVAVALPEGMQVISAEGETRHTVQPNGLVFAPVRQLAPKADTVFRFKVLCQQPGDQRVTVEVKTDDLQPIRREESTRVFGDE